MFGFVVSSQSAQATARANALARGLLAMDIELEESVQLNLMQLVALLHKWNRVYNLTAIRDPDAMVSGHLLDSLMLLHHLPPAKTNSVNVSDHQSRAATASIDDSISTVSDDSNVLDVMDVGSGAGLPVLPLAIARPDLTFLSVESNGKKTRFQQQAILELGIENVQVANQRVETVGYMARIVTARAFTAPEQFLSIAASLVRPAGTVLMMLGRVDRMPSYLKEPFSLVSLQSVVVPGINAPRHVAVCQHGIAQTTSA